MISISPLKLDLPSIFIGLSTLSIHDEINTKENINDLIIDHGKYFGRLCPNDNYYKYYYNPSFYYMFSKFDLLSICLTDDYQLGTQKFGSHHPDWKGKYPFQFQTIIGPSPNKDTIELSKETFLNPTNCPLIALCQLKINCSFIIGGGIEILKIFIEAINEHFNDYKQKNSSSCIHILVNNSFSWHDLTILVFSNSYIDILKYIVNLRELTLNRLLKDSHLRNRFESIRKRLLFEKETKSKGNLKVDKNIDIYESHLFSVSVTSLGFDFKYFEEYSNIISKCNEGYEKFKFNINNIINEKKPSLFPIRRWMTKAGHLQSAINTLEFLDDCADNSSLAKIYPRLPFGVKYFVCTGRGGDLINYPINSVQDDKDNNIANKNYLDLKALTSKELIEFTLENRFKVDQHDIISVYTFISTFSDEVLNDEISHVEKEKHFEPIFEDKYQHNVIKYQTTSVGNFNQFHNYMRQGVAMVNDTRLCHSLEKYNQCIRDRLLFSNFIELRESINEFLLSAINRIKLGGTLNSVNEYIGSFVDALDVAWRNRYYMSWDLSDLTDFNLEYKGGIQLIVTAVNGAYKAITSNIGVKGSFAFISGSTSVKATGRTMHLNYDEVFFPEFFAVHVCHEAVENLLKKVYNDRIYEKLGYIQVRDTEYRKFFDAMINIVNPDFGPKMIQSANERVINKFPNFEKILRKHQVLSQDLCTEIFADFNAYYFVFRRDKDLFLFWYRQMFLGESAAWIKEPEISKLSETDAKSIFKYSINEGLLYQYLLRLVIVLGPNSKDLIYEYWKDPDPKLFRLKYSKYTELHDLVVEFFKEPALKEWLESVYGYLEGKEKEIGEADDYLRYELLKNSFESGHVISYKQTDIDNRAKKTFQFTTSVLHSYLRLMHEKITDNDPESKDDKSHIYLVERKGDGYIKVYDNSQFCYDIRGGMYINDHQNRLNYMRYRNVLMMSLWDMATKDKIHDIDIC